MWLTNLVEGTDYYINFIHKRKSERTYKGPATFLGHTQSGLDISLFRVDEPVVAFPHWAIIHRIANDSDTIRT